MNGWEVQTNAGSDAAITKVAQLEDSHDYNCIVDDDAGKRIEIYWLGKAKETINAKRSFASIIIFFNFYAMLRFALLTLLCSSYNHISTRKTGNFAMDSKPLLVRVIPSPPVIIAPSG